MNDINKFMFQIFLIMLMPVFILAGFLFAFVEYDKRINWPIQKEKLETLIGPTKTCKILENSFESYQSGGKHPKINFKRAVSVQFDNGNRSMIYPDDHTVPLVGENWKVNVSDTYRSIYLMEKVK